MNKNQKNKERPILNTQPKLFDESKYHTVYFVFQKFPNNQSNIICEFCEMPARLLSSCSSGQKRL